MNRCSVKDLADLSRILGIHDLDVHRPRRELASCNGVEHVTNMIVGIRPSNRGRLLASQVLYTLSRFEVPLDVLECTVFGLAELVGVDTKGTERSAVSERRSRIIASKHT